MTKLTTKSLAVYIVATAAVWAQSQPQDSSKSAAIFKQLKSLVGEWEAVQEGVPVKETYTLTANGSVLTSETKTADSLLRCRKPAPNDHRRTWRFGQGCDVFPGTSNGNEDTRGLAQHRGNVGAR